MDRLRLVAELPREQLLRVAAPAAFLLAVTVAVLLIRSGLEGGGPRAAPRAASAARPAPVVRVRTPTPRPATTGAARTTAQPPAAPAASYETVAAGDTFGTISARSGTTVAELERLNPGVSSNALTIGQRLRVR